MKKLVITAILLAALVSMSGCGSKQSNEETSSPAAATTDVQKAAVSAVPSKTGGEEDTLVKSAVSAIEQGMSVASTYTGDVNGDGTEDIITLYTSAEMLDGEPLLEDRNDWLLEIDMSAEQTAYYTLYSGTVSNGDVEFSVETNGEDTVIIADIEDTMGDTKYAFRATSEGVKKIDYTDDAFDEYETVFETEYGLD